MRLREELDREREERNYFQLERDKIHNFWEITDRKLEEVKAELKNLEKAKEDDEGRHRVEIQVRLTHRGIAATQSDSGAGFIQNIGNGVSTWCVCVCVCAVLSNPHSVVHH